jgi:hypothetical protein
MTERANSSRICVLNTVAHTARVLWFLLFLMASGQALAFSGAATDDAFAALLSMPGAEPASGYWKFDTPADFEAKTETQLVAYLAKKQKMGADFNAYRHYGTLLHHAIRAGQTTTAFWLLEHGADPQKPLQGGTQDALSLSQTYKQGKLAQVLQKKYGLQLATQKPTYRKIAIAVDLRTLSLDKISQADRAQFSELLQTTAWQVRDAPVSPVEAKNALEARKNWTSFKAQLQPGVYAALMDDERAIQFVVLLHGQSAVELEAALSEIPAQTVKRHAKAALSGLEMRSRRSVSRGNNPVTTYSTPADVWRTLWRYLDRPLDYAGLPGLAGNIQPELWPELFASGYNERNAYRALGCMLAEIGGGHFRATWSSLTKHFPDIAQLAPRMVLSAYRLSSQFSGGCSQYEEGETIAKLLFLTSLGLQAPVNGIAQHQLEYASPALRAAMQPFVKDNAERFARIKPRWVDAPLACSFTLTDAWLRELLTKATVTTVEDSVSVETVQLIEIPGASECGLLVGGFQQVNGYVGGDVDAFTGPESNPTASCPDPRDRYEVWQNQGGTIKRLKTDMGSDDGAPILIPVKDTQTGKRYYLHTGEQYGQCHGYRRMPFTFEWKSPAAGLALQRSDSIEIEEALFAQCSDAAIGIQCKGIAAMSPGAANATQSAASPQQPTVQDALNGNLDPQTFIDVLGAEKNKAYQAAILALDKPKLKVLQADGVLGLWTGEAIKRVGISNLSLEEKRKRTAWIFFDHTQLAGALSDEVVASLLTWLPREDWKPVLKALTNRGASQALIESLTKKGLTRLACDIDNARGLICGETWGVIPE